MITIVTTTTQSQLTSTYPTKRWIWYENYSGPPSHNLQGTQFEQYLICYWLKFDKTLTLLDPGSWILVITRGAKVPGFNLRALDCCLTFKLCVCFQKYKLTLHEKKICRNLKTSVRFWDLKILWIWDFATTLLSKMAFMCLRNHI